LFTNSTGASNTSVGVQALAANTTADNNTAVGYQAGYTNTTGTENFYGGYLAGNPATGSYLTFVGSRAGNASVTGNGNTAVGYYAYGSGSSGASNTAIGQQALYLNTTASENTAVGYQAGYALVTGTYNVAIGSGAQRLGNSSSNVAVGYQSLYNNAQNSNTAVGYQAGYSTTTDTQIVAIGYQALYSNTTGGGGSYNIAIGPSAHYYGEVDAYYNIAIGASAMRGTSNSKSGKFNTAIGNPLTPLTTGSYCMGEITSGNLNVALGNAALGFLTSGSSNIAIGANAQRNNSTGSNNTVVGYEAMYTNTAAADNVAVGYQAGYYFNGSSALNTYVGYRAGFNSTGANTSDYGNTFIGYQAGYSLANAGGTQTGIYNTFIGTSSGYAMTTGAKNTILGRYDGNQGGLDIRTASNYIVLSDGDGFPMAYAINGSQKNWTFGGIAPTSPAESVHAVGQAVGGSEYCFIASANTTGTATAMRMYSITAAAVVGSITFTGSATAYNTSSDYRLKNSVAPMTGALAKVAQLKPVIYKWNFDGSNGEGFIAHELAEVCPDAVTGEKDAVDEEGKPQYQGIDTSFLVATLTAAIQEQQAIIESLKARLDAANL
jgi:trimeric autotransporter adhesin